MHLLEHQDHMLARAMRPPPDAGSHGEATCGQGTLDAGFMRWVSAAVKRAAIVREVFALRRLTAALPARGLGVLLAIAVLLVATTIAATAATAAAATAAAATVVADSIELVLGALVGLAAQVAVHFDNVLQIGPRDLGAGVLQLVGVADEGANSGVHLQEEEVDVELGGGRDATGDVKL